MVGDGWKAGTVSSAILNAFLEKSVLLGLGLTVVLEVL